MDGVRRGATDEDAQKLAAEFRQAYPAVSRHWLANIPTMEEVAARQPTVEQQAATLGLVRVMRDGVELTALAPGCWFHADLPAGCTYSIYAGPKAQAGAIIQAPSLTVDASQCGSDL